MYDMLKDIKPFLVLLVFSSISVRAGVLTGSGTSTDIEVKRHQEEDRPPSLTLTAAVAQCSSCCDPPACLNCGPICW
ncbi:hypothetical protein K435DRAFT_862548 [Dendrothele bispora CBS 962.96]|uniref:Uncharacterized protein n=1 Tax=Dendrothele bispora (strain CBS 962.96) TaxID=1314807 RepID=A0A4S8LSE5_DENBC|nr:hypothetical protein K435DRAFT_862548 [Dendrothele bispora CBS 962.96]